MPKSGATSVSLIVCQSVLSEQTGAISAIRIMDVLALAALRTFAQFFVLTYLHSKSFDTSQHVLRVRMVGWINERWEQVAGAPDHVFIYSYKAQPSAPGACALSTEFNLDLTLLGTLGTYYIQAWLDDEMVAETPLTLLRSS